MNDGVREEMLRPVSDNVREVLRIIKRTKRNER